MNKADLFWNDHSAYFGRKLAGKLECEGLRELREDALQELGLRFATICLLPENRWKPFCIHAMDWVIQDLLRKAAPDRYNCVPIEDVSETLTDDRTREEIATRALYADILKHLSPRERAILVACMNSTSTAERAEAVSAALGKMMSPAAVNMAVSRLRKNLRKSGLLLPPTFLSVKKVSPRGGFKDTTLQK